MKLPELQELDIEACAIGDEQWVSSQTPGNKTQIPEDGAKGKPPHSQNNHNPTEA